MNVSIKNNTIFLTDDFGMHQVGHVNEQSVLQTWLSKTTQDTIQKVTDTPIQIQDTLKECAHTPFPQIKHVIAICSGKGGVGKSTCTIQLAHQLQAAGARVAILDADIYGPSLGTFFPHHTIKPTEKSWPAVTHNGFQLMSMAYLVDKHQAMMWRGPMAGKALLQLAFQTQWQPCDFLLIDMPPGTGDIALTLAQKIPLNGAVVVTHPHVLSHDDVTRATYMLQQTSVPVLGLLTNGALLSCPHCHKDIHAFGQDKAQTEINDLGHFHWSQDAQDGRSDPAFSKICDRIMLAYQSLKPRNKRAIRIPIKQGDRQP